VHHELVRSILCFAHTLPSQEFKAPVLLHVVAGSADGVLIKWAMQIFVEAQSEVKVILGGRESMSVGNSAVQLSRLNMPHTDTYPAEFDNSHIFILANSDYPTLVSLNCGIHAKIKNIAEEHPQKALQAVPLCNVEDMRVLVSVKLHATYVSCMELIGVSSKGRLSLQFLNVTAPSLSCLTRSIYGGIPISMACNEDKTRSQVILLGATKPSASQVSVFDMVSSNCMVHTFFDTSMISTIWSSTALDHFIPHIQSIAHKSDEPFATPYANRSPCTLISCMFEIRGPFRCIQVMQCLASIVVIDCLKKGSNGIYIVRLLDVGTITSN